MTRNEFVDRNRIDEAALGNITMGNARELRTLFVAQDRSLETEEFHRDLHITGDGTSADDARSLRGDEANAKFDVVTIVFVLEGKGSKNVVRDRQCVAFARRWRTVTDTGRWVSRALETRLGDSREFGSRRRHRRTHLTGVRNGSKGWLGHASRLPSNAAKPGRANSRTGATHLGRFDGRCLESFS